MYGSDRPNWHVDADEVIPGSLWQGSRPPMGRVLVDAGFTALVLCAEEFQPPSSAFPGVVVVHAPNDDDPLRAPTKKELRIAFNAAKRVAQLMADRKRVLVTCHMGLNRSGLVSALALVSVSGRSGRDCRRLVQQRRRGALGNPMFRTVLDAIPARR